jgi:hypothetical protein
MSASLRPPAWPTPSPAAVLLLPPPGPPPAATALAADAAGIYMSVIILNSPNKRSVFP